MSVVAVPSRVEQHSPEPERLTVTLSIPLSREGLTPEASWLIEVLRELVERGEGRVDVVGASAVTSPPADPSTDGLAGTPSGDPAGFPAGGLVGAPGGVPVGYSAGGLAASSADGLAGASADGLAASSAGGLAGASAGGLGAPPGAGGVFAGASPGDSGVAGVRGSAGVGGPVGPGAAGSFGPGGVGGAGVGGARGVGGAGGVGAAVAGGFAGAGMPVGGGWLAGAPAGVARFGGSAPAATGLRILAASRTVLLDGVPLQLTRLEFDVLLFLAENPRRVFSRLQLLTGVWGYDHACARTVDVLIGRLRSKVGVRVPIVTTVYGVGYRLADGASITIDHDG